METKEHPCSVPGWELFEYKDKSWSSLFYFRDSDGISCEYGYDTLEEADAGAIKEFESMKADMAAMV